MLDLQLLMCGSSDLGRGAGTRGHIDAEEGGSEAGISAGRQKKNQKKKRTQSPDGVEAHPTGSV